MQENNKTEAKVEETTKTNNVVQKNQQTTTNSKTVYITPTGKRYHLDSDCGGKNSYSSTLDSAINSGKTACKKCAQ